MKTVYGESFKEQLQLRYSATSTNVLPAEWIAKHTNLKGKRYSFLEHEYQIDFINDKHRTVVAKKCAQIGFTEILLRGVLCFLVQHQGSQGIFTQPTDLDAGKFAKSRVDVVFEDCPIVKKLGTGGIDSSSLKRIGQSFLNLRGTFGAKAAISVPSDINVYDEVDFSNPRVLSQFKSRLQHSKFKFERPISTPTIPNYGVSAMYSRSDQKQVILKCNHCGHYQFLTFEHNIRFRPNNRGPSRPKDPDMMDLYLEREWEWTPFIACEKCELEVDRSWFGGSREWVAKYPERAQDLDAGISGYQISQLDVVFVRPADIVKASDKRFPEGFKKEQDFHNFVLGQEFAGADSLAITDAVREKSSIKMEPVNVASGTFLGIDLGNTCNVVIVKDFWLPRNVMVRTPVVIAAFTIRKEELEEELPKIIKKFGTLLSVSDAQPYTTTMLKIAEKHPGRFYVCYFGGKKPYTVSDKMVTANRTMMLDAVTDDIPTRELLVSTAAPDEYWKHLKNLVKVKAEDDDGQEYMEYVKVGDDHYGLATGYAMLARKLFYELDLSDGTGSAPVEISGCRSVL